MRDKLMLVRYVLKCTDNLDSYKPNMMAWSEWPWDDLALEFDKELDLS